MKLIKIDSRDLALSRMMHDRHFGGGYQPDRRPQKGGTQNYGVLKILLAPNDIRHRVRGT